MLLLCRPTNLQWCNHDKLKNILFADLDDSTEAALKTKLVILFPSPKYLLGKGYLSSEGATESDDVRNRLETEAKARGGDFSEENTQLGLCSNIVKVIKLLLTARHKNYSAPWT